MSDIVRPVPTGPLDPFGGRGGREVEHVAKDRSGNLGCQLQERSPSLGAAFDAKRAETNTQVIRMLMTSRLASGKQPFGRVELSADPDLTAPWEIEQKNTARRRLPMIEVPPVTTVIGPDGPVPFGDVFEGRAELVVYSHMFYDWKPWEWQCEGCTRNSWPMQDATNPPTPRFSSF